MLGEMRVLLISTNRETLPDPVAPLGLALVGGALRQAGHEVHLLDVVLAEQPAECVRQTLEQYRPELIGINIRNVDNVLHGNSRSYLGDLQDVVSAVQQSSAGVVLLGGSGFSLLPREFLHALDCSYGIVGEGEVAAVQFANAVAAGTPLINIPGVASLTAGAFQLCPQQPAADLNLLPQADRTLIDNQLYSQTGGSGNVQTKRGCCFNCIYCTYPLLEGRSFRTRDPAAVADEIEQAASEFGIGHFYFVDNVFTHPVAHAQAVCHELIARRLPVRWSCYGHPSREILPLLDLMREAGCQGVDFGTDVAADEQLRRMGKTFSAADIIEVSLACRAAGLPFCHSLLIGGPGETRATVAETFDVINRCEADAVVLLAGIRIFPGTPLAQMAIAEGQVPENHNWLEPVFYLSSELPQAELELLLAPVMSWPNWVVPARGRLFDEWIQRKIRKYGFKGPLWEYLARVLRRAERRNRMRLR